MKKTVTTDGDEGVRLIVRDAKPREQVQASVRDPIHVVYGGAHLFRAETAAKFGRRAIDAVNEYAPNFVEFAHAMMLPGTGGLPRMPKAAEKLESQISRSPQKSRDQNFPAWFAWTVYTRTLEKLNAEPVEDFRIDFEDGYGPRPDPEEDGHAEQSAKELARAFRLGSISPFCGIRIKSFAPATRERATRTLEIFLRELLRNSGGRLPSRFAVTLPKVTDKKQIRNLRKLLTRIENKAELPIGSIDLEIMIETPDALFDKKGRVPLRGFVKAAGSRRVSAHFGAYDYTSALSIAAPFQDMRHPACDFARNVMQANLSALGIRISDSITAELPVPVHRGEALQESQVAENRRAVHHGWRTHFENVSRSMSAGIYQSWDLHPNQLPARYAAVYSFFIYHCDAQARRLHGFLEKAAQASLSGTTFDDAASAHGVLNFFRRALACGALTGSEVESATGLTAEKVDSLDFADGDVSNS